MVPFDQWPIGEIAIPSTLDTFLMRERRESQPCSERPSPSDAGKSRRALWMPKIGQLETQLPDRDMEAHLEPGLSTSAFRPARLVSFSTNE
jgi:hypothetical protein